MDKKSNIDRDIDLTKLDGLVLEDEQLTQTVETVAIINSAPDPEREVKKKKSKKLIIIISSISAAVLLIAGILIWLFVFKGIYVFQGLPLESFSNSVYSVNIPKGYEKIVNNMGELATDTTFYDSKSSSSSVQSKIYIVSNVMTDSARDKYLAQLDSTYSARAIEESKKAASGFKGQANIVYSKSDFNGFKARRIDYTITRDKDHVGRYSKISLFKEGRIYEIIISANSGDFGLMTDIEKIFTSFKLK